MVEYSAFNRKVLGSIPRQPILLYFLFSEITGFEPALFTATRCHFNQFKTIFPSTINIK